MQIYNYIFDSQMFIIGKNEVEEESEIESEVESESEVEVEVEVEVQNLIFTVFNNNFAKIKKESPKINYYLLVLI